MANRLEKDEGAKDYEGAVAYMIEPGKDGNSSIIFVFRGTMTDCEDVYDKLFRKTALCTGPEEKSEERPAKLIIMDARGIENN